MKTYYEKSPAEIKVGDKLNRVFPGYPGRVFRGVVTDINNSRVTISDQDGATVTFLLFGT